MMHQLKLHKKLEPSTDEIINFSIHEEA
jgi:hypothetical protein